MPTNMLAPYGQPEKPAPGSSAWDWAKYALQHPGGDVVGTDLMTLTKRLPPALLRKAMTLPKPQDWANRPGKPLSEAAKTGLNYLQEALYEYAEKYPRLMSHFKPWLDFRGTMPGPNMPPTQAEFHGRDIGSPGSLVKNLDTHNPHANITFYPAGLETITDPITAKKLLRHETSHGAQWVTDPSRFNRAYDDWMDAASESSAGGYISNPAEKLSRLSEEVAGGPPLDFGVHVNKVKKARREWAKARSGIARHPNEPVETRRGASRIYGPPGED
jgi:hypothetical protein